MKIKKVILLTIDSLRYDRLGIAGYPLKLTPTLDFLAKNGINCTQTIAHASCTQMSQPSISTSSLPLDFGGYDHGIKERPVALAEVFQNNGFKTATFASSFYLADHFGYDKGFDELYPLYTVGEIWSAFRHSYLKFYLSRWHDGELADDELIAIIQPLLENAFQLILNFCEQTQTLMHSGQHIDNPSIYRADLSQIAQQVSMHLHTFRQDPMTYLGTHSSGIMEQGLNEYLGLQKGVSERLASFVYSIMPSRLLLDHIAHRYFISQGLLDYDLANGSYILDVVDSWLERHQSDDFFLWFCLDDIHSQRFSPGSLQNPLRWPHLIIEKYNLGRPDRMGLFYDLAIKYVDSLVARMIEKLKQQNILDETLIVLCSDHGALIPLPPLRAQASHLDFYEEKLRVPLIFWNPHIEAQKIDHLCGLIDLAPTLVDLMGFSSVPVFQGHPVYSAQAKTRKYLIAEDAASGPSDIANKALRIAVRTPDYKYIWQEAKNGHPARNELYHLKKDPQEQRNLVNESGYETIREELQSITQQRWETIKNENY